MAEYPNFKHGVLGEVIADGFNDSLSQKSKQCFVYIGTAPVHQVEGGAANVNVPIVVRNIAEARRKFGYSDNWANYTLCEAMHVHFEQKGVGPLIFINVLNPNTHRTETGGTASLTPSNGRVTVTNCEDAILDTLVVARNSTELVKGTDYTASYDFGKNTIVIREVTSGSLGTTALTITWSKVDPSAVTEADVIGTTDNYGLNTGVHAIKSVFNVTGYIPAYIAAPGFSSMPAVHTAMWQNSQSISGHWNAWMFVDMPIVNGQGTAITLATAPTWKESNGYNKDNESVFYPLALGTDGRTYHLSVLNAANFQELLIQNSGVPYMTGSNTECSIIQNLYFQENVTGRVYTDDVINRCLNANGINSAAFVGGHWVIWGMFAGSYNQGNATMLNVFDTGLMMLYYLTNDFQYRRNKDIDKPMPINTLRSIVAEEQTRVDALLGIGALTYGKVTVDASRIEKSDLYQGDFRILFNVTNTPLTKSLTAVANWTEDGFEIYFDAMMEMA